MVAGNSPPDLEAALHEIETLKRELAERRRRFAFELKLLDLAPANIFDFLKKMDSKGDIAPIGLPSGARDFDSHECPGLAFLERPAYVVGWSGFRGSPDQV
jgi:hypothetical protein